MFFSKKKPIDESLTFKFIFFITIEQSASIFINLLFSKIVSSISDSSLAAKEMGDAFNSVINSLFSFFLVSAAIVIANYVGANDDDSIKKTIPQYITLTSIVSIVLTILLIVFATPIMTILMPNADEQLYTESLNYYIVLMTSVPLTAFTGLLQNIAHARNKTKHALIAMIVLLLSQLAFGYILIIFADMSIMGAALALTLARIIQAVILVGFLIKDGVLKGVTLSNYTHINKATLRLMFKLGTPAALESLFVSLGYLVAGVFTVAIGSAAASVNSLLNVINRFIALPQPVVSNLGTVATGHLLGAGKKKEAKKYGLLIDFWGIVPTIIIGGLCILFPNFFLGFFSSNPEHIEAATGLLVVLLIEDIAGNSINAIDPQLRSGGDVKYVMTVTLIAVWAIKLPLSWLFVFKMSMGVFGILLANTISLYFRMICGLLRFCGNKWMKKFN